MPETTFSPDASRSAIFYEYAAIWATPEIDARRKRFVAMKSFEARNHLSERWVMGEDGHYVLTALVSTAGKSWGGE